MDTLLQTTLDWIALHPHAFNIVVFTVALMESLVVLGLLIPGAALLFGAGALIATGALQPYPILLWTTLGAALGDIISFLLGRHYHQRLRVVWPFRRYPALVNRGVDFFVGHGGKGIFMARFIGPLRPVVPAIAGMMSMSTARFLVIDSLACLLWAPVYILPGIVFGASLGLAAEVAGRLVVLLIVIAGLGWGGVWLIASLIRLLQPHAARQQERLLMWSHNHPRIRPLAGSLLDPEHPEARGLAILSVLFFITLWLLLLISRQVLHGHSLEGIDAYVFHGLSNLRTPWADSIMLFFTRLGDRPVLALVMAGGCLWLFWRGYSKAALHWLAVYGCTGLLTWILKITTHIERPVAYDGSFSFPSSHTSMSVAVYGFLALLVARELPHTRRWLPYFCAGALIVPISLSRLYLGAHWLSDVLAGLSLGIFWVALIGIAYDRHPAPVLAKRRLLGVTAILLVAAVSWQARHTDDKHELAHYTAHDIIQRITRATWTAGGWERLPAFRIDLEGHNEQPLNFQWAGSLETLYSVLTRAGWHPAPALSPLTAMNWLAPKPAIGDLPLLPEVNDGKHQQLLLIGPPGSDDRRLVVVRLWPSNVRLVDSKQPVWIGKVGYLHLEDDLPLITYLRSAPDYSTPLQALETALRDSARVRVETRNRNTSVRGIQWHGEVLLARAL
jgi:membrane protein DedA with SNARE-associated domain/membrane-associated phospholipid phosphatase